VAKGEVARGKVARGEVARDEVARGEVARGEVARGEVAKGEVLRACSARAGTPFVQRRGSPRAHQNRVHRPKNPTCSDEMARLHPGAMHQVVIWDLWSVNFVNPCKGEHSPQCSHIR
jgi:hypothetical protein